MLVVFSKKQVEIAITCYFKHVETSRSHMNQIMQHSIRYMANSVDPDQPASSEAGGTGSTLFARKTAYRFRKLKMLKLVLSINNAVYLICNVTKNSSNIFSEKAS